MYYNAGNVRKRTKDILMKKIRNNKNTIHEIPKYKRVIPMLLCIYMMLALFVNGMEQKSILLIATAVAMILWYIGERIFPDLKYIEEKRPINKGVLLCMGIFLGMTLLSEIFSKDYSYSTLRGNSDSVVVIVGYVVLFYMTYMCVGIKHNQEILLWEIVLITTLVVVMSVLEFLDVPIAGVWLENGEALALRNRVVLTFGNSNYYGMFCCMLIPFVFEMWIHCEKKIQKVLHIFLNAALVCCVFMSKSTAAVYLTFATIVLMGLFERKKLCKQWKWLIEFMGTVALIGLLVNAVSGGKLYELSKIGVSNADAFVEESNELYEVKEIWIDGKQLTIEGEDSSFVLEYDDGFTFYDEKNNVLDVENDGNRLFFTESPYDVLSVEVLLDKTTGYLLVEIDAGYKDTIDFYIVEGYFKGVGADGTAIDDISGGVRNQNWNGLFTGRGYIWANTLPLLMQVVLIGKGCGNFVYNFKQYDYVGLLESQGTHKLIIDRPHNMFLQYSVDVGMIGTIALFAMIIRILFGWMRWKMIKGSAENVLSVASFFSVVAFLVFMLLNDSLVVLSPYMWIFMGINFALQDMGTEHKCKSACAM